VGRQVPSALSADGDADAHLALDLLVDTGARRERVPRGGGAQLAGREAHLAQVRVGRERVAVPDAYDQRRGRQDVRTATRISEGVHTGSCA